MISSTAMIPYDIQYLSINEVIKFIIDFFLNRFAQISEISLQGGAVIGWTRDNPSLV